jgi:hypothetical protein
MKTFANIITAFGVVLMLPFLLLTLVILAPIYFAFTLIND